MRYYCPECKSEYAVGKYTTPGYCTMLYNDLDNDGEECGEILVIIPDFETPAQYEKRTGKKWNGAVWFRKKNVGIGGINENGDYVSSSNNWDVSTVEYLDLLYLTKDKDGEPFQNLTIFCAASPKPPPYDYVPEVEA